MLKVITDDLETKGMCIFCQAISLSIAISVEAAGAKQYQILGFVVRLKQDRMGFRWINGIFQN